MKIYKHHIAAALFLFTSHSLHAQESVNENKLHHRATVIISHAHIPAANELNGDKKTFIAASLGINYELWFNSRWAIGVHNDLLMESFNVETKPDGAIVKREFPIVSSLVTVYKPFKHWSFFAGPGIEFEKNENFALIKTGIEYSIMIPKSWEVAIGADYDYKFKGYSSWLIGIGISKLF